MDALQFYLLQMKPMAGNGWAGMPDGQHWRTPEGRREFAKRGVDDRNKWSDDWWGWADMVNLYAEHLRQMYQDHLDGKVTLVAYDQPELLGA